MKSWYKRYKKSNNSGDGWVYDESGERFWGSRGAGMLFVRNHPTLGWQMLLCKRVGWSQQGGTWSGTGGAIHPSEDPYEGAVRETKEELGFIPPHWIVNSYTWKAPGGSFTYTTFICQIDDMNWEPHGHVSDEVDAAYWVSLDKAIQMPLHSGFADMVEELGQSIYGKQKPQEGNGGENQEQAGNTEQPP